MVIGVPTYQPSAQVTGAAPRGQAPIANGGKTPALGTDTLALSGGAADPVDTALQQARQAARKGRALEVEVYLKQATDLAKGTEKALQIATVAEDLGKGYYGLAALDKAFDLAGGDVDKLVRIATVATRLGDGATTSPYCARGQAALATALDQAKDADTALHIARSAARMGGWRNNVRRALFMAIDSTSATDKDKLAQIAQLAKATRQKDVFTAAYTKAGVKSLQIEAKYDVIDGVTIDPRIYQTPPASQPESTKTGSGGLFESFSHIFSP